jgi:orotidine-5'-phosphate decarboxylase
MNHHVICALDTTDLEEARRIARKLTPHVGAFKIGHALTMDHGLDVIDWLRDEGATRIFLDLKFHDIPNTVALAVREAARRGVWMMTLHISGGPAMLTAAVEEANDYAVESRPLLVGVSVLTSLDETTLRKTLGIPRSVEEHMVALTEIAMRCELDGVVCSPQEVRQIRAAIGREGVIVTPGIRLAHGDLNDQRRTGDALTALRDGADYLVIGRALIHSTDCLATMREFGLASA